MVLKIFVKGDDPDTREAIKFGERFEERGFNVEYLKVEEKSSTSQIELYDIYSYPSFLVTRDDGSFVECWRGFNPLFDDVLGFLNK